MAPNDAEARLVHKVSRLPGRQKHHWALIVGNNRSIAIGGERYANAYDALHGAMLGTGSQFVGPSGKVWSLRYGVVHLEGWTAATINRAMEADGIA